MISNAYLTVNHRIIPNNAIFPQLRIWVNVAITAYNG